MILMTFEEWMPALRSRPNKPAYPNCIPRLPACQWIIHRSVSVGADEWEYAEPSVRDKASFVPVFASGLIALLDAVRCAF
jgi:hypothetical protein